MTSPPIGVERRIGQRFTFNLPVALRDVATAAEGLGITQDLSSRGAFLLTDMPLRQGAEVELTLKMPSEITLGESMSVRCRGRVLRVIATSDKSMAGKKMESKIGVAVCIQEYEYLTEAGDQSAFFRRVSALHAESSPDRAQSPPPPAPRVLAN